MENAKNSLGYKVVNKLRNLIATKKRKVEIEEELVNDFSIISCNCIGGMVYHDLKMKFLSPTINLYIDTPDFIKMCLNLKDYMEKELVDANNKDYPIGILGDIKIHFLHYKSFKEAKESWDKRKERINYEKIFVIISDRDNFSENLLDSIDKIPYKKVLYSHKKIEKDYVVYVEKDKKFNTVRTLTDFINFKGIRKYEYYFDIYKWLSGKYTVKECLKNKKNY
ncbi:MAG: DUF1919 domain-containing protein [Bacilli bacterium]|nr:DUF1919 domain-containing protein [Bacilli bacterium]